MHELFTQVLGNRDLSRAGDLFSVADSAIVNDLTEVLTEITSIASLPDYCLNDNDQSVVEICVTRVTSCIRETGSAERHSVALVALLESCLHHSLQPSNRDEDPPHAKIASDIISSIFLNYSKRPVMEAALPVAVRFLHKGNKELSRNLASYLSLAAIENASLLSPHVQPILDSIISGNYPLCRVLAQIYEVSPDPLGNHAMALVALLPHCDLQEQLALLHLFSLIAKKKPLLLEASVPQLCEYLTPPTTASATMQVLLCLAEQRPSLLAEHVSSVKAAANRNPSTVCVAAQIIAAVGKLSRDRAQEALNFVLEHLPTADRGSQTTLLREATLLCSSYPVLFTDKMLSSVRQRNSQANTTTNANSAPTTATVTTNAIGQLNQVNQTSGGVTIVKLGGPAHPVSPPPAHTTGPPSSGVYTRRAKLGDSRSTGRLHSSSNTHRSMTRLNIAGGSVGGLHSMSRLSSSQHINQQPQQPVVQSVPSGSQGALLTPTVTHNVMSQPVNIHHTTTNNIIHTNNTSHTSHHSSSNTNTNVSIANMSNSAANLTVNHVTPVPPLSHNVVVTGHNKWGIPNTGPTKVQSGGVTVTTAPPRQQGRPLSALGSSTITVGLGGSHPHGDKSSQSHLVSVNPIVVPANNTGAVSVSGPVTVTSRRTNNTSVTILNANNAANQRMSVFEPYPMRDTVQHFCEKHLDKIKSYMDSVSSRIPPPAKCTIEERRAKKLAKLHFACQARGQHCLYSKTFFTMRTRNPRIWIHLMFIALQARSQNALSSRDTSVSSLKHCWDMLKCENKTFLTLVTSAFPCSKDQETLINELRHSGFFDVFELGPVPEGSSSTASVTTDAGVPLQWGCFLCNHPERAMGFLRGNTQPVIEGQLKEKKGRWRLFRRWRTRYFTLSGAHLSCKGSSGGESIDINQIRSVKVSRGARNIPKAFEIFTGDQTLILKPKDGKNAEEWVQCLSIVVAHSQSRDAPAGTKSNSLPARGLAGSRTAV